MLIPFAVSFAFIVFVFYRQNRENQVRKELVDLELKALRAQMNPHFIFNCLNSIYYSIQEGNAQKASVYLLKFSFLTRRVLENSGKRWISLSEELEILRAYLDLELLRKENQFTYTIEIEKTLNTENISVPMLLTQPLIENSIWHGFSELNSKALLKISVRTEPDKLIFIIEDNGSSNSNPLNIQDPIKQKSMGTSLVKEQLRAIELLERKKSGLESTDKFDSNGSYCGRIVSVDIPLLSFH